MAKTRAILKRRKAIKNIRKITRTMELIATARYKKAMDRAVQAESYTRKIAEIVSDLSRSGAAARHPLLEAHPKVENSVLLVLTSNRGLCGGYNGNVLRVFTKYQEQLDVPGELEVSGKRGLAYCRYRQYALSKSFTKFEDKPSFEEVEELADRYIDRYVKGEIDRLDVIYTRFHSAARQTAVVETLLPMSSVGESESTEEGAEKGKAGVEYDFLPSAEDILTEIVPVSFKTRLFKCFLDAAVSEQIARMVAMKGATENAGTLMKSLASRYNRARQSQITSELSEIIGTAEALK